MSYQQSVRGSGLDVFTPQEHAVISHWLGLPARCGDAPPFETALAELGLPEAPDFGVGSAEVAAILLSRQQDRLPGFSHIRDGVLHTTRPPKSIPIQRALLPPPVFLFAIDWSMTAPGFGWPCDYNCVDVPGYDRRVVTCSYDTDEVYGAADAALGSFEASRDPVEGSLEILEAAWLVEARREGERWQFFLSAGAITEAQASALADKVWAEPDWDDEEEVDL